MDIEKNLYQLLSDLITNKYNIDGEAFKVVVEIPKDNKNGDYSTNVAMRLTKQLGKRPQEIAREIADELSKQDFIEKIDIAGPGFINFYIKKSSMASTINKVIEMGDDYGKNDAGKGVKLLEEYVSANPTGPLHCGHARGAVWGDSCVRIMNKSGFNAVREYYINDAGAQILNLGKSVYGRIREIFGLDFTLPEDGYHGPDVIEIAKEIVEKQGDKYIKMDENEAILELKEVAKMMELERIKVDLKYYGCEFDSWISEQWIVDTGKVEAAVKKMNDMGLLYEQDGAIWFKASLYGDDKDRVLKKSDGYYTYMTPDIANHLYKYDRGYEILVNIWGADHHGYIPRMKAAMEALGYPRDNLQVDICQMVRMVENGVEVKMSKRTGNAITLRELIDDIGLDCTRYFFLSKELNTHMDFDLTLARTRSNDNPVYYIQYAYARINTLLEGKTISECAEYNLLTDPKEIELIKYIAQFPQVVGDAAISRSPNKICNYVHKLASYFHSFYGACRIYNPEDLELSNQRLALSKATQITIKNALDLLGVSAPDKMERSDSDK